MENSLSSVPGVKWNDVVNTGCILFNGIAQFTIDHKLAPPIPVLPAGDIGEKRWSTLITIQQAGLYPKSLLGFATYLWCWLCSPVQNDHAHSQCVARQVFPNTSLIKCGIVHGIEVIYADLLTAIVQQSPHCNSPICFFIRTFCKQ